MTLRSRIACSLLVALWSFVASPLRGEPTVMVNLPQPRTSITIDLADYLRSPDGSARSHHAAFVAALEAARQQKAARLVIPPGRYVFADPQIASHNAHLLVVLQQDLEIDGQGAELVFTNPHVQGIVLAECQRVVIRNLSIDWDAHLASGGVVQKRPDGTTAIRIYDDYPVDAAVAFEAVSEFDVAARKWKGSANEVYAPRDVRMIGPQTFISGDFEHFAEGAEVLVRHRVYGANAVGGFMMNLHDVTIEDVTVYSAPGMAFYFAATGQGIRLNRCTVRRREDRLISTTADAAHFTTTGGHILVENSDFSGMGDDAVSINAFWLRILEQRDPLTVRLGVIYQSRFFPGWIMPGTELLLRDGKTMEVMTRRRVLSVVDDPVTKSFLVKLDAPLDATTANLEAIVGTDMMDSATFMVRNNRFHDHRGRGLLLMARNGLVEHNTLIRPTMACVNVTAEAAYFFVGFGAGKLLIRQNRFEGCNTAGERIRGGTRLAAVNVFAHVAAGLAPARVHANVTLEDNTIIDTPGAALLIASARGVTVRRNSIVDANTDPASGMKDSHGSVWITQADDIRIVGHAEHSTKPTYAEGIVVNAATTSNVVVATARRRAAGRGR